MLMGSFNSSHPQPEEEEEEEDTAAIAAAPDLLHTTPHSLLPSPPPLSHPINAIHMRQLVITCADLISHSDFTAAHRILSVLSANSSPDGDSIERLLHQLARALFRRLHSNDQNHHHRLQIINTNTQDLQALHSCYLTLNQITPFIRFCHLTANQAILEIIDETHHQALHILDFDIMHGLQWPPFMQALVERHPMLRLRITATGTDLSLLRRTGDRLLRFAQSLGLHFQFHPLLLPSTTAADHLLISTINSSVVNIDEALAVNCVLYLHRLLKDESESGVDNDGIQLFLRSIKALNPTVVTVAEREANHTLADALDHYTAIFDSLEATLPPNSRERLAVEQVWLGREIMEVVAAHGGEHNMMIRRRSMRYESWEIMLRSSGFSNVPLSPFALSQAKLLLRLHYPSEGYQLHILNDSFFLGWQNRPLFSVSSWH